MFCVVEEKSKTLGRGMVVSRFKRCIVFASEVRAEADSSSHLFAVPLIGINATQQSTKKATVQYLIAPF